MLNSVEVNENVSVVELDDSVKVIADFRHFGVIEDGLGCLHLTKETAYQLAKVLFDLSE